MMQDSAETVSVGYIAGLYGVRGWVKVFSHTSPKENILTYSPWLIAGKPVDVLDGRLHGKGLIAKLDGVTTRETAAALMKAEICVYRHQFARLPEGEYYWSDLIGLKVVTVDDVDLGQVTGLMETGANDVLVVDNGSELLIPWVMEQVIKAVDLQSGLIRVDWEADF
jgi:16S rRNA processing protein RimM